MTCRVEPHTASAPHYAKARIVGRKTISWCFFLLCRIWDEGWKLKSNINCKCHCWSVWNSYNAGVNGVVWVSKWVLIEQSSLNTFRAIVFEIDERRTNLVLLWKIWITISRNIIDLETSNFGKIDFCRYLMRPTIALRYFFLPHLFHSYLIKNC